MNLVLFTSFTIFLLSIKVYADNHEALIFDRVDRTLFHLPTKLSENKCGAWATACPADPSNEEDKKFIDLYSITKKPLFVKDTYDNDNDISEVKQNICKKPFALSLTFNIRTLIFEFGYEVHYVAKKFYKHYTSNPDRYKTVTRATENMRKTLGIGFLYTLEIYERTRKHFTEEGGTKWYNGKKMNLVWIPMFKLRYNFSSMVLIKVMYEIRRNNTWPVTAECDAGDYVLGKETYQNYKNIGDVDVDQLYANQENIFNDLKLPKSMCPSEDSCPIGETSYDANQYLKKWSLIPIDQFHLYPWSSLSCSNITTIPIWRTMVEDPLKKLDQFLYALHRYLDHPIHVVAGTIGVLQLPKNSGVSFSDQTIYLDPKNELIPAPKLIYKIIKYTIPNCELEKKLCKYSAIVFIHNDPNFKAKKKMCKDTEDITESWGWSTITTDHEGKVLENIYVCQNNEKMLKKMFGTFSIKPRPYKGELNLRNFPFPDRNGNIPIYDENNNIENKVINKFNELSVGKDDPVTDEVLVSVPQANFDDFEGEGDFMEETETQEISSQQQT